MDNIIKIKFQDSIRPIEEQIEQINTTIKDLEKIKIPAAEAAYKYQIVALINHHINLAELYMKINDAHFKSFRRNSDQHLELCRKHLSTIVTKAEASFSIRIHTPTGEHQKMLDILKELTPLRVYNLVSRLNKEALRLRAHYPASAPISETLRRIYRDLSGFSVNLVNFKSWYAAGRDLHNPNYESINQLFRLITEMINASADMIMESFQMTKNGDAVQEAMGILDHLEGIQRLLKDPGLEETVRKKESWARFL